MKTRPGGMSFDRRSTGCEGEPQVRKRIAEILAKNKTKIIDQQYEEYCQYISHIDKKKRDVQSLKKICTPVQKRFLAILDRFIQVLDGKDGDYSLEESKEDIEYALRFLVPARYKESGSHTIIRMTESYVQACIKYILAEIDGVDESITKEDVAVVMPRLIYIVFEDLWVSSLLGFRLQHSMIQQLLSTLMRAQEKERQNFWREIHDQFLQILAVIPIKLEIIDQLSRKNLESMREDLTLLDAWIKTATQEIRNSAHGFNLFWVEKKGFIFSLKSFVTLFEKEFRIPVKLDIELRKRSFTGFPAVNLFRIIQEGLYNIGKHSKANYAKVKVELTDDQEIVTTVEDDGTGFDVKNVMRKSATLGKLGLAFIRERARLLNGFAHIDSTPNRGTSLSIRIPACCASGKDVSEERSQGTVYRGMRTAIDGSKDMY